MSPLVGTLVVLIVVLLAFSISMAVNVHRLRTLKRQRGLLKPWPIRKVSLHEVDDIFAPDTLGPTLSTEVSYIGAVEGSVRGGTTNAEAWILAVLAKRSTLMFEFGTCTGKTAYLWARNLPPDGRVVTLTLLPEQVEAYNADRGDLAAAAEWARHESAFTSFRYSGSGVEQKIVQLYGDSKQFDETPYVEQCDVVFVDGAHGYSYVMSDSRKALRMVKPGGIVLWHDYRGPREVPDVFRALNELARELPLVHIGGTALVAYRKPGPERARPAALRELVTHHAPG